MMIIVIRRNIDKVSGFPDIILGDIYYWYLILPYSLVPPHYLLNIQINDLYVEKYTCELSVLYF